MPRGKSQKSLELVDASVQILQETQPATVRSVAYKLFIKGITSDMGKNETNKVSRQLTWAREEGIIPWEWVVDETREAERIALWDAPESIVDAAVQQYRRNNWNDQDEWIEVWSEKGTVRGTLDPVLKKYGITFRVMHGYGSATALHDVAEESSESCRHLTVLYVGDYDCSGMHMSEADLPERIYRYDGEIDIVRIALTYSDVAPGTSLPFFPAKRTDTRYNWYVSRYGNRCWELDALSPNILRDRVEQAIIDRLDIDAWEHALSIERAEVESMRQFHDQWKKSISVPACLKIPRPVVTVMTYDALSHPAASSGVFAAHSR